MEDSPESSNLQEDGELSDDGDSGQDSGDLFVVDCQPTENHDRSDVPVYDKKFDEVLQVQTKTDRKDKPKGPKRAPPPANTCWNCGGGHSLRECEEPRNFEAISRNRNIFMSKNSRSSNKAVRYHLDDQQKYPHVQAGKISKRLRRALGLLPNQLPRHIYRMRCLGYPPGWVEEAKVSHSGVSLFNSEGKEVADPGFEDGEIVAEGAKDKFDIKKIIAYPGFNCPCGEDVLEEFEWLNSKPMAEKDSIKFMKTMWQDKAVTAYKRKKMNTSESGTPKAPSNKKRSLLLLDDMELDSDGDNESVSDDAGSPNEAVGDMSDIKETKNELESDSSEACQKQATKRAGSVSPASLPPHKKQKNEEEEEISSDLDKISNEQVEVSGTASIKQENAANEVSTPVTPTTGRVTSVSLGTPVIVVSEFTQLPSAEKFSKNICDVINFENLPDATGKYEKMSGLIKKVRSFVTKLNCDEDDD